MIEDGRALLGGFGVEIKGSVVKMKWIEVKGSVSGVKLLLCDGWGGG